MELIQTFAPDKNQINIKICEILHSQKIVEFRIQVKIGQTQKNWIRMRPVKKQLFRLNPDPTI